jgi:hypothetical protein
MALLGPNALVMLWIAVLSALLFRGSGGRTPDRPSAS